MRARGARPRVRCGCCPGRADGFASPRRAGLLGRISVVVGPLVSGGVKGVYPAPRLHREVQDSWTGRGLVSCVRRQQRRSQHHLNISHHNRVRFGSGPRTRG